MTRNPLQNLLTPQITHFDSCDSTNRLLLAAAESGAATGSVYVAREQTAGRGRRGRTWVAAPGDSLTFSLLWTFPADPARLSGLSLAVGLAVVRAISEMALGQAQGVTCGLKWPNDILLMRADGSYAKAGGILVESTLRTAASGSKELAVVIGIGLNCTNAANLAHQVSDQSVGSLSELFVNGASPDMLLSAVLPHLFSAMNEFAQKGFIISQDEWNAYNLWQDQPVQIREGDVVLHEGICRGVSADGVLCIETTQGMERIISGDVSLRKV